MLPPRIELSRKQITPHTPAQEYPMAPYPYGEMSAFPAAVLVLYRTFSASFPASFLALIPMEGGVHQPERKVGGKFWEGQTTGGIRLSSRSCLRLAPHPAGPGTWEPRLFTKRTFHILAMAWLTCPFVFLGSLALFPIKSLTDAKERNFSSHGS